MARPRIIDREALLDHAEQIVSDDGAPKLTFGALAAQSSVPKASIQSVFGTREKLLDALIARWMDHETVQYQEVLAGDHSPQNRLRAHLVTTAQETEAMGNRLTSTMAAMVGNGKHSQSITAWYEQRLDSWDADGAEARQRRIAYLAAEGAYYLRYMAKVEMSDDQWRAIFADLAAMNPD